MLKRAGWWLVVLAPALSLGLQLSHDVDPWKLMGFGMYATPPRRPMELRVQVDVLTMEGWQPARLEQNDPALTAFRGRTQALGALADPQPFLEEISRRYHGARVRAEWDGPRLTRDGRVVRVGAAREFGATPGF